MRILLALALASTLVACGGKKQTPESAGAAPTETAMTAEMPDTPEARKFASSLIDLEITNHTAVAGSGAELTYNRLTFAPDGVWTAEATIEAAMETFDCQERGTWSIESAESGETATMVWSITKTTCPTREVGTEQRLQMTLFKNGDYKLLFR